MRCVICGRVIPGTESRLPEEDGDCEGCQDEFQAWLAVVNEKGVRLYTDAQAFSMAKAAHHEREIGKFVAKKDAMVAAAKAAGKYQEPAPIKTVDEIATEWAEALK